MTTTANAKKPRKVQPAERRLAMRLAIFAYQKCEEHRRRGRNITISQLEQRILEHVKRQDVEKWLAAWIMGTVWTGADRKIYENVSANMAYVFVTENRELIAEVVLST